MTKKKDWASSILSYKASVHCSSNFLISARFRSSSEDATGAATISSLSPVSTKLTDEREHDNPVYVQRSGERERRGKMEGGCGGGRSRVVIMIFEEMGIKSMLPFDLYRMMCEHSQRTAK